MVYQYLSREKIPVLNLPPPLHHHHQFTESPEAVTPAGVTAVGGIALGIL